MTAVRSTGVGICHVAIIFVEPILHRRLRYNVPEIPNYAIHKHCLTFISNMN